MKCYPNIGLNIVNELLKTYNIEITLSWRFWNITEPWFTGTQKQDSGTGTTHSDTRHGQRWRIGWFIV